MRRQTWRALGVGIMVLFGVAAAGVVPPPTTGPATRATTTRVAAAATVPASRPAARPVSRPTTERAQISPTSIATEADSATMTLDQTIVDATVDRSTGYVAAHLPPVAEQIDAQYAETTSLLATGPLLQTLATLEQDWAGTHDQLAAWSRTTGQRLETLRSQAKQLDGMYVEWQQSRRVADFYAEFYLRNSPDTSLHTALRNTVAEYDQVLDKIVAAQSAVGQQLGVVFTVNQSVDAESAKVNGLLRSVRAARAEAFDHLFTRTQPPVWEMSEQVERARAGAGYRTFYDQVRTSAQRQLRAAVPYVDSRYEEVGLHATVVAVLAGLLVYLRVRVRAWAAADPTLGARAVVPFATPISTAVVLSLVVAVWLYPRPPQLFRAAAGAAILVPAVLVLRRLLQRRLFPLLAALVVSYLLDQVRNVAAAVPVVPRAIFLVQMFGGAVLMAWYVQARHDLSVPAADAAKATPAAAAPDRVGQVVRFGTYLYLGVLFAAFVGDALGFVVLSELVGGAALDGAYLAMVLYAGTRIAAGLVALASKARPLSLLRSVRDYRLLLVRRLTVAFEWVAVAAWVYGMLQMLSLFAAATGVVDAVAAVSIGLGTLRFTPTHLLVFGLTIYGSILVSRFIRFVLAEDVYVRFPMAGGLSYAVNQIVHYAVLLVGFYIAVAASGVQMTQFTLLAGAFGVGLGFGLQNVVNNFVSGLILLFERPVKVGDVVQIADTVGVVDHIGIRASIIRTMDSSEIIVPNGNLLSNQLTNWTLSNRQRGIMIPLTLGAESDPKAVMPLLIATAAAHPRVLARPAPQAFLTKIAADAFGYELHAWTAAAEQWAEIRSDVQVALHAALTGAGVAIK